MLHETATAPAMTLDLIGLKCPLPVLHTRKALAAITAGSMLDVRTSDPLAVIDIPHLLATTGDTLVALHQDAGVARFLIRKCGPSGK